MITVYGLTNEHGQICYVGQTRYCARRFRTHLRRGYQFTIAGMAILARTMRTHQANLIEQMWITFFGLENLFNINKGGGVHIYERSTPPMIFRTFRLEPMLVDQCNALAERAQLSFSELVRTILRREVGLTKKGRGRCTRSS